MIKAQHFILRCHEEGKISMDDDVEILLVEDNPSDVELTVRALKKSNTTGKILVVTDGAQALDFIFHTGAYAGNSTSNPLKLILLDLKLPKVDGIEVLRKIKSDEAARVIPIVILTSSDEGKDVAECYGLGANSYIVKPVDFNKFIKTVMDIGLYWLSINKPFIA